MFVWFAEELHEDGPIDAGTMDHTRLASRYALLGQASSAFADSWRGEDWAGRITVAED